MLKSSQGIHGHNLLRHSFASYRLALLDNLEKVAYEMGNTPDIITTNYRELVEKPDAEEWFSVYPETRENKIINIA